jgi:hypothetical protein
MARKRKKGPGQKKPWHSPEFKRKVRQVYISGRFGSIRQIAEHYNLNRQTVSKWIKREGWNHAKQEIDQKALVIDDGDTLERIAKEVPKYVNLFTAFRLHVESKILPRKGETRLPEVDPKTLSDLMHVAERALTCQRLIKGEPTQEQLVRVVYQGGDLRSASKRIHDAYFEAVSGDGNGHANGDKLKELETSK